MENFRICETACTPRDDPPRELLSKHVSAAIQETCATNPCFADYLKKLLDMATKCDDPETKICVLLMFNIIIYAHNPEALKRDLISSIEKTKDVWRDA